MRKKTSDKEYQQGLRKYCDDLVGIIHKSNEQFEKQLSYISAGALGLSFIVIEKVLKDLTRTTHKWLLIAGWIFLALTLIINLFSHKLAVNYHYKSLGEVDGHLTNPDENDYDDKIISQRNKRIDIINTCSIILLTLGITSLLIYTSINLTMADENKTPKKEQIIPSQPKPQPELPNLKNQEPETRTYSKEERVPNIVDKGHPGLPPKKPGKK